MVSDRTRAVPRHERSGPGSARPQVDAPTSCPSPPRHVDASQAALQSRTGSGHDQTPTCRLQDFEFSDGKSGDRGGRGFDQIASADLSPQAHEPSTLVLPEMTFWPVPLVSKLDEIARRLTRSVRRSGSRRSLLVRLETDHLVRNSIYLMLSSGLQASLGFAFWITMARLFVAGDVGRASTLISASSLLAYFALFGLNTTLVRHLPSAEDKHALVTGALVLAAAFGACIGLIYVVLTPIFAPRVAFISHRPLYVFGFSLLTAGLAVNLMTDSVFIASRKASLCAVTDGIVGGGGKLVLGVLLAGTGAYGIFFASGSGFALAALVSVTFVIFSVRLRFRLRGSFRALRVVLGFSAFSYIANSLNLLPSVVVPIIVLDRLGPEQAAYYFVAFQIAALLYAAVQAVEQAFLAEGSQLGADWRRVRSKSRLVAAMIFVPGCALLAGSSRWILLAFGVRYSRHGTSTLELLALAVIPIAFCNWSWTVLRLTNRLHALVLSNAVFAVSICGMAWVLAPHGLTALTTSWPIGGTVAAALATAAASWKTRASAPRHRRSRHPDVSTQG